MVNFTQDPMMIFIFVIMVLWSYLYVLSPYLLKWKKSKEDRKKDILFTAIYSLRNDQRILFYRKKDFEVVKEGHEDLIIKPDWPGTVNPEYNESKNPAPPGSCYTVKGLRNGSDNKWKSMWTMVVGCTTIIAYILVHESEYCPKSGQMISKLVMWMRCKCENCGCEHNVDGMKYANGAMDKKNKKYPKHPRLCYHCAKDEKIRKEQERTTDTMEKNMVIDSSDTCYICLEKLAQICLSPCINKHMSVNGPVPVMCKGCARKMVYKKGVYRDDSLRKCPLCRTPFQNTQTDNGLIKAFVGTPDQMVNRY